MFVGAARNSTGYYVLHWEPCNVPRTRTDSQVDNGNEDLHALFLLSLTLQMREMFKAHPYLFFVRYWPELKCTRLHHVNIAVFTVLTKVI